MARLVALTLSFFSAFPLTVQGQGDKAVPDLGALSKAGHASLRRLETEGASWTATTQSAGGFAFVVDVLSLATTRRWVLSVEAQGRREEFARVIQKNGVWYVIEEKKVGKYRPYEAPFDIPTVYLFLTRAEPRFIGSAGAAAIGNYAGSKNGLATYRSPLPEHMRKQLVYTISEYDEFLKKNPKQVPKPESAQAIENARRLLRDGVTTDVDLQSGLITQFGAPELRTAVSGFRWRERVGSEEFATSGKNWGDFTDDPTSGDPNELLMISHSGVWSPGMRSHETDGRLFDVKTGRVRRIAFQGTVSLPGCFTKDRTRVIVTGANTDAGLMGLYEIDLKTGVNRQLGGALLATGFSLFPALSPDGKTVAVLHKGASGALLGVQICLVDLATGDAKPLGKPLDTGPFSWLPNGEGLVIVDRKQTDASKPAAGTVCRLDLNGRLTKLCQGSSPRVLGDGKRILFEEASSTLWKTCNLDGGDIKLYADGMKGCAFPAPSPDGKRLLMMRFQAGRAPVPTIFALDQKDGTAVTTAAGLWASPAWR